ncbi:Alpha-ketoglutarate-dependent dioxygenase AlkB [Rhodobacteraceae bacterium THAF1]|uniref:alpha-ketoglutarate-dependent dioxygenase AlkB family protein n=1 Tax=Palleronia sp. THAF1 TaxID=2587842 RepID=UPI000F3F0787|nr:alpha-ketoglutarate-dependent dioxygenase AlkB [Palleronia sp. THAF1]QFU07100.1 Alpha-ketoglutarate-dependent dioxygenase AlkB [Palleronia sp. THAF1]VDC16747.1 Alpha-ketoglutarate-dependent dioxygenase AlkB [Rhodobacteraceae bacterium THAF1]
MNRSDFSDVSRVDLRGVGVYSGAMGLDAQRAVLEDLRGVIEKAPLFHPETARGRKMSVRMTSAGHVGWVSDRRGYRYEPQHPRGMDWPPIPTRLLALWDAFAGADRAPDTCLINFYGEGAKMGLHQDRDEADLRQPVLSLSLGDDALFRVGNVEKGGKTESLWLHSGDVAVIGGAARLVYHGIDRVRFGSSALMPKGGRVNVTMRVAG